MGIIDDMENFIFDHFSVTKRHNVHQIIEITNNGGQQTSRSQQQSSSSEVESRTSPGGQRSDQMVSRSQQGQITTTEHVHSHQQDSTPGSPSMTHLQNVVSSSRSHQNQVTSDHNITSSRQDHQHQQQQPGSPSFSHAQSSTSVRPRDTSNSPSSQRAHSRHRSPQISSSPSSSRQVPSSPFRERVSWHERGSSSRPPSAMSDIVMHSPQLEHRPSLPMSPIRTRNHHHRASWVELSNLSSLDNLTSAHLYSSSNNNSNRPPSAGPSSTSSIAAVESPTTPQKQNLMNEQHVSLPSTFRSEPRLSSLDRPAFMVAGGADLPQFGSSGNKSQHQQQQQQQYSASTPTATTNGSGGITITTVVKPKLVRLRSEPSSFSLPSTALGFPPIDPQSPQSAIRCQRRRRAELKRSQSLEVASPSCCQEELWTGINVPSQLVITRPQLSRSRLNRKHLSLQLEGMSEDLNSLRSDPPLTFHDTHGDNIQLLNNKSRARRHESFCKGICFSNRPINVNERVYVKFVETNTTWSGVLRFGFTSVDPASIQGCDLPRYACPDLTNKPGNWAKALGELYTTSHILLRFSVSRTGDVTYAVNGEDKGLFFSGVDTSKNLWAMLDIYGNTVAVEFSHANAELDLPNTHAQFDHSPVDLISQSLSSTSLRHENHEGSAGPQPPQSPAGGLEAAMGSPVVVHYHTGVQFSPLPLHALQGRNIRVTTDRTVAARFMEEYCNAFVFTSRPLNLGETLVIQVLGIDRSYIGGLGFGLTACDPSLVQAASLPDDSDLLLDRPEYWVVNKDVCRNPEVGDELSFHLTPEGEVKYARNNQSAVTLMHVDKTLPLWAFFDVYGNIQKIKVLGCTMTPIQSHIASRPQSINTFGNNNNGAISADASLSGAGGGGGGSGGGSGSSGGCGGCFVPTSPGYCVFLPPSHSQQQQRSSVANPTAATTTSLPGAHVLRSNSVPDHHPDRKEHTSVFPASLPATPTAASSSADGGTPQEDSGECKVCCERSVNCVLYTCGHMCLCYTCASVIRQQRGECPICRHRITDIIKVYRS